MNNIWGGVIGALGGALINGVTSAIEGNAVLGNARRQAEALRQAAGEYSGDALNKKMTEAGSRENIKRNLETGGAQSQFAGDRLNMPSVDNVNGYQQGAQGALGEAQARYAKEVGDINARRQSDDANVRAMTQGVRDAWNVVGQGLNTWNDIRRHNDGDTSGNTHATPPSELTSSSSAGGLEQYENPETVRYTPLVSDEGEKDFERADVRDTLRQLRSIIYKYKDEAQDELGVDDDIHVGITAQSMEGTPIDDKENVVVENGDGLKMLDKQKLLETVTAGIAEIQREIDELTEDKDGAE